MSTLIFPCGCQFPVDDGQDGIIEQDPLDVMPLRVLVDMFNIPQDCPATWHILGEGRTKGVFQLEGQLGRTWAKKVKPSNLEDLGALVALLRPGCLRAVSGDPPKSMTQRYADRKRRLEDVDFFDVEQLEPILGNTYGVLVYQEQAMKISVALAGFDKQQADVLRKAIGKKKADIMSEVKGGFITGCQESAIVTPEKAEIIFGWIQESQRYSFNKCLCPTTIVETSSGPKTLDEIEIGDRINSPSGYTEIVNKYDNGEKGLFEITLESGIQIRCTLDHEFLCEDNKKHRLSEIISENLSIMCDSGV